MVFEDLTIRELSMQTFEETQSVNLLQANKITETGEKVVDFALDRELNAIAVATDTSVYLFDY